MSTSAVRRASFSAMMKAVLIAIVVTPTPPRAPIMPTTRPLGVTPSPGCSSRTKISPSMSASTGFIR